VAESPVKMPLAAGSQNHPQAPSRGYSRTSSDYFQPDTIGKSDARCCASVNLDQHMPCASSYTFILRKTLCSITSELEFVILLMLVNLLDRNQGDSLTADG
jgi:hypothetical protein